MKNKKWLRSIAFILLLTLSVCGIMHCYSLPKTYNTKNLAAFHAEKENLIDGVLLGTSVVAQSWLTPVAWQEYGLATYHLSTNVQAFGIITEYLEYAQKTQNIKYAVIDIHGLRTDAIVSSFKPARFQSAYLDIPDFSTSLKVRKAIYEYGREAYSFYGLDKSTHDVIDLEAKSYFLPFINFHNRWLEGLKKADFVKVKNEYMGADDRKKLAFGITDCSKYISYLDFDGVYELDDFQKEQLNRIFDYAKQNDMELLFINLPSFRSKEAQFELNGIIKYCEEQGYNTIDFATHEMIEELNLELASDFSNKGHLNSKGGRKTTKYICEYLINNGYYTIDHRNDSAYSHWDTVCEEYNKYFQEGWSKQK